MICDPCAEKNHDGCIDWDPVQARKRKPQFVLKPGRLYRSCVCQHKTTVITEPATGPAGD